MPVQAVQGVGKSSVAGNIAGLGRAAMMANFIQMIDEWLAMLQAGAQTGGKKPSGLQAELPVAEMLMPPSPFYTFKRDASGQFSVQKAASADIAATMLLAVA